MHESLTTFPPSVRATETLSPSSSLMLQIGIVEGDVLEQLEQRGAMSLYRLIQTSEWRASLVIMAVGALLRDGLIAGSEERLTCRAPTPEETPWMLW